MGGQRAGTATAAISRVGVVGAGIMGQGVSHSVAASGRDVVLVDISREALRQAQTAIKDNCRMYRLFASGELVDPGKVLARITSSTDFAALRDVDFVVENVAEDFAVKQTVYRQLDETCPRRTVFAANTSAIPITRIAAQTRRPAQVIGMHFMNPLPLKPMVEVIRGYHTSDATVERARELISAMGKDWVVVGDSPGFVTNRVLMVAINEAAYLVYEKVATPEEVDRLVTSCFGHKMGMLETADLIGVDTVLRSIEMLHEAFGDSKYRPCPLLRQMVDAGLHGRKSGQGFYRHNDYRRRGKDD
jgi:3-hydroxybutyryl-CoA dehydrogenase